MPFLAWNRIEGKCGHNSSYKVGILDVFIEEDQAYYLQQLQAKYPTCDKLNTAFPSNAASSGSIDNTSSIDRHRASEKESNPQTSFWEKIKLWFGS